MFCVRFRGTGVPVSRVFRARVPIPWSASDVRFSRARLAARVAAVRAALRSCARASPVLARCRRPRAKPFFWVVVVAAVWPALQDDQEQADEQRRGEREGAASG